MDVARATVEDLGLGADRSTLSKVVCSCHLEPLVQRSTFGTDFGLPTLK